MLALFEIIWDILGGLAELYWNWRFILCLIVGMGVAVWVKVSITHETLGWSVSGVVLLAFIVVGWRWDSDN